MAKNTTFSKTLLNGEISALEALNRQMPCLSKHARNLNLMVVQQKIGQTYNRDDTITNVKKLLLRLKKANVLLTGPAGCGKTAIAEGLAWEIVTDRLCYCRDRNAAERKFSREAKKATDPETGEVPAEYAEFVFDPEPLFFNTVIYELSMNSLVSGTKYRGDFEEKMESILEEIKKHPNVVLFVDEIHQINDIGGAEGCSTMGQILKPALARDELRVIGATTTEESEIIKKDKALARRFSEVIVKPLSGESALGCLEHILADYANRHGVGLMKDVTAKVIMEKVNFFLPNTVFPDNAINIIDEAMAGVRFDGRKVLENSDINAVVSRMTGIIIV